MNFLLYLKKRLSLFVWEHVLQIFWLERVNLKMKGKEMLTLILKIWGVRLVWDDFLIKLLDFWKLRRLEWGSFEVT